MVHLPEDGTRDRNNRENISIDIRYVKDGVVKELLLQVVTTKELDAKLFTKATLNVMHENNLDISRILSQCFDSVGVMSGRKGGVAVQISQSVKRNVPYVHCYNQRLHLVVLKIVSEVRDIRQFFDQSTMSHDFFQWSKIAELYEGRTIVRLLEQQWSGHLAIIIEVILSNYEEIMKLLNDTV